MPTATSVRTVPAKLMIDNRIVINNHLKRARGGKVSFTHLIAWAMVQVLKDFPSQNVFYDEPDGKPSVVAPAHINLGIAIDLPKPDGTRSLLVPAIKRADTMTFAEFLAAYEDVVSRARNNKLTAADFQGVTISLTNPGGIGTEHSVPRLMRGQGCIVGAGALEYPAAFQGSSPKTLSELGIGKTITLTSTYDHRVIQGAGSGEFLKRVHELLIGENHFYEGIFAALRIPYDPIHWAEDINVDLSDHVSKTARVQELINSFRVRGHLMADIDPLEYQQRSHPDLEIGNHGLTFWDLDREFVVGGFAGKRAALLREVLGVLRDSYCRTVGIEYMHIQDPEQRAWFQERLERPYEKPTKDEQLRIMGKLNEAEAFETFLQTKYVGQKRFSLEGGESTIALLDEILQGAAEAGLDEVAIGMAHRGRLNVLTNIAGKTYGQIFREFEGTQDPKTVQGSGDVKYHLGTEGTFTSRIRQADPRLPRGEPVAPRGRQRRARGHRPRQAGPQADDGEYGVLPILVHGDASMSGQGVVVETLQMSQLRAYKTGGTVHVVINNQVGFTTPPTEAHSSVYSTDVAKTIQAPIFHVNGDDPEAVVRVAEHAFAYRQQFKRDVVIDLVCYRRRGHNEGDDPSMTQPLMYNLIEAKRSVRTLYTEALVGRGDITEEEYEAAHHDFQEPPRARLRRDPRRADRRDAGHRRGSPDDKGDQTSVADLDKPDAQQAGCRGGSQRARIDRDRRRRRRPHRRRARQPARRLHRAPEAAAAAQEALRDEPQRPDRLGLRRAARLSARCCSRAPRSGSSGRTRAAARSSRGTRSSTTARTARSGCRWRTSPRTRPRFSIYDSLLSEYAALAFEYGYSVERPDALVLWEAQFGDFANGAQTVIDEFISSAEQKWGQRSSVVMLLPHGYEGQGPDHSSARIERYLQLAAEDNMTVARPSTPASYAHLLRRQAYARPRRPLIVFTPKSMLRLKGATSEVADFTSGKFEPVLDDARITDAGRRAPRAAPRGQAALRPAGRAREARRRRPASRWCGSSSTTRCRRRAERGARALPGRRGGLGAGRAGEPGRLAVHQPGTGEAPAGSHAARGLPSGRSLPAAGSTKVSAAQQATLIEQALAL